MASDLKLNLTVKWMSACGGSWAWEAANLVRACPCMLVCMHACHRSSIANAQLAPPLLRFTTELWCADGAPEPQSPDAGPDPEAF